MSGGNTETLLAARASYKKQDGYLYLTEAPHRVVWVNGKTGAVPIQLLTTDCTNLYANKAGVKPPKLRVVSNDQEFNFVFTAEEPVCFLNRDSFRDQVKTFIRQGMAHPSSIDSPSGDVSMDPVTPEPEPDATTPPSGDEELPPDSPPPALNVPAIDPIKEMAARMFRLRKKVLLRDPELAALHRAVVIKGKLSETDFWSTRQYLIDEAAIADSQRKGKSSRLVDPKPALSTSGDMKVVMTPQLALDIFEEWPVVARAFRENVSSKMTEAEFWKRYFESRLYHNHKASVRSSAAQHIIKEDPIFDQYLEPVDDDVEPRHARKDAVNVLVDLVATREDHGQTGNTQDVTMQAGKQKSTLPLIRKFNEHSERLLNSALGEMRPVKRARLDHAQDDSVIEEIDMEDLHASDNRAGIALDMKNRQRYFEGRSGTSEGATNVDFKSSLASMKGQLAGWDTALKRVHQDTQPGIDAVKLISKNIYARTKVKSTKLDVSPDFYKQMRALEASANEYLRHFWFLILPPPEGVERLSGEERGKKVGSMRDELLLVQKRGPELVHVAATNRWDSAGVEEALKPMMGAIDKALGFVADPAVTVIEPMTSFLYPSPTLEGSKEVKTLRIARHCACSRSRCLCPGLHPHPGQNVEIVLEIEDAEFSEAVTVCECGHSWSSHGALNSLVDAEIERRAKVALRADEFLEEAERLEDFTFVDPEIDSLLKQMELPPGEERDASLKRGHSPASVGSGARSKRSRSLSSSGLSDIPKGVKRRRINSSPLSDEDEDAEEGEQDEDHNMGLETSAVSLKTPATPTVSKGLKAAPVPVLSGARTNARAGKKRAAPAPAQTGNQLVNGTQSSHVPKIKLEDDMDDRESVSETVTTATVAEETQGMSIDLPPKEKAVVEEHARGYIMSAPVQNDGTERSYIILTGLKNLFQRQLPKMPREYISRLVMDPNSRALAIVKHGYKVVAGITYRPFPHRGFIEIVFCAVSSSNQVKGYGGHLMDHFKKHIQIVYAGQKVETFLTYADNYAVGYFKKQGFSKDVTLGRAQWAGYIKDYEGATLLQCTLVPVDYTTIRETLTQQKEWLMERIRRDSSSHVVHDGIPAFQGVQPPTVLEYKDIPGLLEAGWTAHPASQEIPANIKAPDYVRMTRALRALQAHQQSWPFRTPVNKVEVPDYYEFIKNPMDLHTMQTKLENGEYTQVSRFIQDVRVIGENCLAYNPHDSVYAKAASKLMRYFEVVLLKELEEKD